MSLAAMIAKQKAQQAAATEGSPKVESVAPPTVGTGGGNAIPSVDDPKPVPAAGPKLKFGIKGKTDAPVAPAVDSTPRVADPSPVADVADSPVVAGTALSLDDIGDTTIEGLDQSERGEFAFDDEIPATAPVRDLPPELESQQLEFVTQLNGIYEVVHDPELFGQMIRIIMQELQENPDYVKLMADQDVHTMIRGLRQSMGLAKVKKAEKVTKTRGAKKAPAASAMLGTADAIFNSEDW